MIPALEIKNADGSYFEAEVTKQGEVLVHITDEEDSHSTVLLDLKMVAAVQRWLDRVQPHDVAGEARAICDMLLLDGSEAGHGKQGAEKLRAILDAVAHSERAQKVPRCGGCGARFADVQTCISCGAAIL